MTRLRVGSRWIEMIHHQRHNNKLLEGTGDSSTPRTVLLFIELQYFFPCKPSSLNVDFL